MAAIKILDDVYIVSQLKGTPDRGFRSMDYFNQLSFLSNQLPQAFPKTENGKEIYLPALGDYVFSSNPGRNYVFENKENALDRAKDTLEVISDLNNQINFGFSMAKSILGVSEIIDDGSEE